MNNRPKNDDIMTCGHLIEILSKFDPNRSVIAYPQTDFNKEQVKLFIKGAAELDHDNQVAILMDPNKFAGLDYEKIKLLNEEGSILTSETDGVSHIIV